MYWHCRLFSICVQLGVHIRLSWSDPGQQILECPEHQDCFCPSPSLLSSWTSASTSGLPVTSSLSP